MTYHHAEQAALAWADAADASDLTSTARAALSALAALIGDKDYHLTKEAHASLRAAAADFPTATIDDIAAWLESIDKGDLDPGNMEPEPFFFLVALNHYKSFLTSNDPGHCVDVLILLLDAVDHYDDDPQLMAGYLELEFLVRAYAQP